MSLVRKEVLKNGQKMAAALSKEIGSGKVVDDPDILEGLGGDESHVEPIIPDFAVRVKTHDDVVAVLTAAKKFSVPVTPRAGGTGKAGGAIPVYGGFVLDVSRMNQLLEINRTDLTAIVEPGLVTGVFQEAVEDEGLFYPPDPASMKVCTLGGNVAEDAGGPKCLKYGVTSRENW
jgi:glycolate oxidase